MKLRHLFFLLLSVFPVFPILGNAGKVAVVLKVKEEAFLKRAKEILPLKKGDIIQVGDKIEVEENGMVIIKFLDKKSIIRIKENTVMKVKQGGEDKKVSILMGEIISAINGEKFSVETPTSVAAVKGTEFSTAFISDTTKVAVNEGIVELSNDKGSIILKKGETGVSVAGKSPEKMLRDMSIDIEIKTPEGKLKTIHIK